MVEVNFASEIIRNYNELISFLPPFFGTFVNLFLLVLVVFVYVVFIWEFHRFISKKNLFEFNLNQYNNYEHPFLVKLFAGFVY